MPYENCPNYVDETPGTKYYCSCGESKTKPYCDGSHANSGKAPTVCNIETANRYAICDCGTTKKPPFCDGSHSKI